MIMLKDSFVPAIKQRWGLISQLSEDERNDYLDFLSSQHIAELMEPSEPVITEIESHEPLEPIQLPIIPEQEEIPEPEEGTESEDQERWFSRTDGLTQYLQIDIDGISDQAVAECPDHKHETVRRFLIDTGLISQPDIEKMSRFRVGKAHTPGDRAVVAVITGRIRDRRSVLMVPPTVKTFN